MTGRARFAHVVLLPRLPLGTGARRPGRGSAPVARMVGEQMQEPTASPPTPYGPPASLPEGLDWSAFADAYFPGRHEHNLEAIVAYGAYRRYHQGNATSVEPQL